MSDSSRNRPRVVMVRPIDIENDSRAKKISTSLVRGGYDVTVLGRSPTGHRQHGHLGDVKILLVPPRTRLRGKAQRVVRLPRAARRVERRINSELQRIERAVHRRLGAGARKNERYLWVRVQRDFRTTYGAEIVRMAPDVVHVHDPRLLPVAIRAINRIERSTGRRPKLVYDSREDFAGLPDEVVEMPRYHAQLLKGEQRAISRIDALLTVSDDTADVLHRRLGLSRRPTVLFNAPPLSSRPSGRSIREDAGVAADVPVLVFSGGLGKHRGVDHLVEALPDVPAAHVVFVAVPFPHPREPEMTELAARLGVAERVHYVPPVAGDEVPAYIREATVGISTTPSGAGNHDTTLPNKLFEMLHAGLPIVTSDIRAMARFVEEKKVGVVYRSGDTADLARAIREVLEAPGPFTEPAVRAELSRQWSWQAQEDALLEAYGRIAPASAARDTGAFPSLEPSWG